MNHVSLWRDLQGLFGIKYESLKQNNDNNPPKKTKNKNKTKHSVAHPMNEKHVRLVLL